MSTAPWGIVSSCRGLLFKKGVVVRAASDEVFPSEEAGEGFRGTGAAEDVSVEAAETEEGRLALLGVGLFSGST